MSSPDQQPVQRDPVKRLSDARKNRDPRERLNRASGDSRDPSARLNAAKTDAQYGRGMPSEIQPSEGERGTNIPYLPDRTARRFLAGVLDIGGMASATNEYVPDWAESYVGAGSLKELGAEAYELYKGDGEEYDAEDVNRAITRGLDQAASFVAPDHSQAAQDFMADRNSRQEEEGEFGSFANAARRNPIGALRYVGESATRAAPTMLASAGAAALTGGGSTVAQLGTAGGVGALIEAGAQAKDASLNPETGEYTDLTTNEKLWGLGSGLAAGSVEGIAGTVQGGTVGRLVSKTPAGRAIARMVGATADDVGEEASEEAVKAVGRRIRDYATEAGQNATTEGATEAVQNLISNYGAQQGWDPERELTEGVLDEALAGAFLGGGTSTVSSGANEMGIRADRQRQEKAKEITEQYGGTFRVQDDATANRWSENLDGVSFERGEEVEIDLSPTPRYNSTGEVLVTARQEDGTQSLFTTTESELQNGDPLAGMGFSAPDAYESIFDEGTLEPLGAEPAEEGRQGEIAFEEEEGPTDARQRAQRMRERRVDENARAIEAARDRPIFGEQARRDNARIGEIEASDGDTDVQFLEREVARLDAQAARLEDRGEDATRLRERQEEVGALLGNLRAENNQAAQPAPETNTQEGPGEAVVTPEAQPRAVPPSARERAAQDRENEKEGLRRAASRAREAGQESAANLLESDLQTIEEFEGNGQDTDLQFLDWQIQRDQDLIDLSEENGLGEMAEGRRIQQDRRLELQAELELSGGQNAESGLSSEEGGVGEQPVRQGDRVQWTSQGSDRFDAPKRVTGVVETSDGERFVRVEGEQAAFPETQIRRTDAVSVEASETVQETQPTEETNAPQAFGSPASRMIVSQARQAGRIGEETDIRSIADATAQVSGREVPTPDDVAQAVDLAERGVQEVAESDANDAAFAAGVNEILTGRETEQQVQTQAEQEVEERASFLETSAEELEARAMETDNSTQNTKLTRKAEDARDVAAGLREARPRFESDGYIVQEGTSGRIHVVRESDGQTVDRQSSRHDELLTEYFAENETQIEERSGRTDPQGARMDEYPNVVANQSENPIEVAEAHVLAQSAEQATDTRNDPVLNALVDNAPYNSQSDFVAGDASGDEVLQRGLGNWVTEGSTTSQSLGQVADQFDGVAVNDLIETMRRFDGGPSTVIPEDVAVVRGQQQALKERFQDLTGKRLTPELARQITSRTDGQQETPAIGNAPEAQTSDPVQGRDDFAVQEEREISASENQYAAPRNAEVRFSAGSGSSSETDQEASFSPADYDTPQAFLSAYRNQNQTQQPDRRAFQVSENGTDRQAVTQAIQSGDQTALTNALLGEDAPGAATATGNTVFALVAPENVQVTKERARSLGFTVTSESDGNRRTRLSLNASDVGNSDPQQQSMRLVRYEEAESGPAGTSVAYREGATTGAGAVQGAGGKTVLTGEARIYDLATDPEGVVENEFDAAEVRESLEGRGYDGFEQNGQVALFSKEGFDSVERGVTQSDLYEARAEAPARRSDLIDDESYLQGEWTQDNRLEGTELSVRELPTGEWEVRRMDRRVDVFDSQEAAKTGALTQRAKDSMNAGDSAEEVTRAVVDALFADSPVRDRITVVSEESDLPSDVRQAIETKEIEANGVFVGETGRIYLLPENIGTSPSRAITVALHETAGHLGLRTVLGDRLNSTLDRMWSERLQLSENGALEREEVRQIVMDYGIDFQTRAGQRELMEEVLARRAEQNVDIGFMEEVYAAVREFLRERLGFDLQISDAEIRRLIANSKRYARTGQYGVRLGPSTHNFGYEIETLLTMRSASQAIDDAYGRGAERVRQNIQQSLETAQTRFSRRPVQGEGEAFEEEINREEEIPERMGRRASVDEAVEGVEEAQEAARAYAEAYDRTLRYSQAEAPQDKEGGASFDEMWDHVQAGGARPSTQRSRLEEVKAWMDRAGVSVWYNSYFKSTFRELDRYAERYPALREIRDKLYTDNSTTRDEDRSEQDLMRRMELRNGEFMSDLAEVMRPIRDREGAFAWNQNREMHTRIFEILLGDEVGEGEAALATAARRMRQMLDRLAQYQIDAGMMDAESIIENYFPQVYRTDYIENNAERFIEWATEKWVRRLNETGWTPEDQLELGQEGERVLEEEARERAIHLYKKLTKEGGMALEPGSSTKGYKYGKPNHLKQRSLDWISPQEKAEWLVQDPTQLMISYVNRTVQNAEFTRSFGQVDISEAGKSRIRDAERALESVRESGDESAIKSAERSLENTRLKEWQDAKPPVLRQAFRELKEAATDPEQNTPPDWLESRVESMMDAVRGTYELETAQENRTWNRAWQNMKSLLGAIMLTKSAFITSSVELGSASIRGGTKSIGAYGRLAARAADKVTNGALGLENMLGTTLDEEWVLEQAGVMGEGVSRSILEARYFSSMGQQAENDSFGKLTGTLYTAMGLKAMTDATRRLAGYTSKNVVDGLLTKETYSAREQREIKRVGFEENIEEMRAWYAENKGDLRSTRGSDELEAYKYALLMVSDGIIPEPNEATVPVGASSNSAVKASLFQYLSFVHSHLTSGPAGFVRDEIYDSFQDGAIEGGKTLFTMAIRFLPMLGLSYMNEIVSTALSYDDDEREERDLRRDRAPSDAGFALELWMNTGMMPFGAQTSTRLFQGVTKYNSSMWDQLVGPTYGKIGATGEAIVNSLGRGNADPMQREIIRTLPFLQAPQQRDLQEWAKED